MFQRSTLWKDFLWIIDMYQISEAGFVCAFRRVFKTRRQNSQSYIYFPCIIRIYASGFETYWRPPPCTEDSVKKK
jgi:hypothetical protein